MRISQQRIQTNYIAPTEERLQGFPEGWYAVAFSKELAQAAVLRRKVAGRELVVFRTESGEACVFDAFCPHLGAHLAEGGKVVGERIQCPFHGFQFDTQGKCIETPYGESLPTKCLKKWHVQEAFGAVLCFLGDGEPSWSISEVAEQHAQLDWSPAACRIWVIRTHPAEIIENTVDIGHFSPVHGYEKVEMLSDMLAEGPHLNMNYRITRNRGLFGKYDKNRIVADLNINASGVGHSRVQVYDQRLGLQMRTVVMPTPIDDELTEVRVTTQVGAIPNIALLRLFPQRWIKKLLSEIAANEMGKDFLPDKRIWENKIYQKKPSLVRGDGPIIQYRRWTEQFQNTQRI